MGSFNTKCFVTQQMITPNTKSVIFPIIQNSTYEAADLVYGDKEIQKHGITSTTCYSDAFFEYAGPMFFGKYDDYGRFSIDKADNNHRSFLDFFNMLHKKSFVTKEGKSKYRDFSFNFKEMFDPQKKYEFNDFHRNTEYKNIC